MKRLLETSFLWILLICEILFYFTDILDMTWKFITLTSCFNTEHVDHRQAIITEDEYDSDYFQK